MDGYLEFVNLKKCIVKSTLLSDIIYLLLYYFHFTLFYGNISLPLIFIYILSCIINFLSTNIYFMYDLDLILIISLIYYNDFYIFMLLLIINVLYFSGDLTHWYFYILILCDLLIHCACLVCTYSYFSIRVFDLC